MRRNVGRPNRRSIANQRRDRRHRIISGYKTERCTANCFCILAQFIRSSGKAKRKHGKNHCPSIKSPNGKSPRHAPRAFYGWHVTLDGCGCCDVSPLRRLLRPRPPNTALRTTATPIIYHTPLSPSPPLNSRLIRRIASHATPPIAPRPRTVSHRHLQPLGQLLPPLLKPHESSSLSRPLRTAALLIAMIPYFRTEPMHPARKPRLRRAHHRISPSDHY